MENDWKYLKKRAFSRTVKSCGLVRFGPGAASAEAVRHRALVEPSDATPLGLRNQFGPCTQGRRSARQPWADRCNPFGIERNEDRSLLASPKTRTVGINLIAEAAWLCIILTDAKLFELSG